MTARFETKSGNVRGYISHEFYTDNKQVLLEVPALKYLLEKYYPGEKIVLYGELYHDVYGNVVEDPLYNEYDCFVAKFRNEDWFQNRLNIYEEIWDNETGDNLSSGRQPIMSTDDVNMALSIQNGSMSARTSGLGWDETIDYIKKMSFEDFSIPMYRSDAFEQTIKSDASFSDFYPRTGKKDDIARLIKTPEEIRCFDGLYKIIRGWLICSTNVFGSSNHIPSEMTLYVSNGHESYWFTYYLWA